MILNPLNQVNIFLGATAIQSMTVIYGVSLVSDWAFMKIIVRTLIIVLEYNQSNSIKCQFKSPCLYANGTYSRYITSIT